MMKKIFSLILVLLSLSSYGQNKIRYASARTTDTAYTPGFWSLDSAMRATYYRTADSNKVLGVDANGYLVLRTKTTGGGSTFDTTAIYTQLGLRVKYTDTAAMLSPYYRTATATTVLAAKQAYSDTTTWDATKKNLADTAAVLRGLIPTGVDTTSLSNRINERVKYTDTASMLANYLNSGDIGVSVQAYNANTTLLGNTTSGSGSTILLQGSPTITLPSIAAVNVSGGILSFPTGSSGTLMRLSDTTSLSNRINERVKYTDTAAMLAPYLKSADVPISYWYYSDDTLRNDSTNLLMRNASTTVDASGAVSITTQDEFTVATPQGGITLVAGSGVNLTAPSIALTGGNSLQSSAYVNDNGLVVPPLDTEPTGENGALYYNTVDDILYTYQNLAWVPVVGSTVTAASVSEINTGTDNDKFVSPLGLAGSEYLDQSGSKIYATTAGTSTAYTLTLSPVIAAYTTGLMLNVKFHLANTGAATINVNGLGAKSMVKLVSTALVANDIVINQWYTLVYDGTNFLVKEIGLKGVNTSAAIAAQVSDETGSGVLMFGTSPTVTTSIIGGATFAAFNTVTTNLSLGGAATTMTIGGTPTTAITHTYSGNATANATTKAVNIAPNGVSGSTTNLGFGSAVSGANNTYTFNRLLTSGSTNDSLVVIDPTTGALKRISSARIGGTSGPDTSAWHKGGDAVGSDRSFGTTTNFSVDFLVNNTRAGRIATSATNNVGLGLLSLNPSNTGAGNTAVGGYAMGEAASTGGNNSAFGYAALARITTGSTNTGVGYQAGLNIATGQNNVTAGYQAMRDNTGGSNNVAVGTSAYSNATSGDNNITLGYNQQAASATGSNQLNIGGGIFGVGLSGSASSPAGRIGIGTSAPNASAILDLTSTTGGFLPPRMTGTQAAAITPKAEGLMVYVTDTSGGFAAKGWYGWNGAAWEKLNP